MAALTVYAHPVHAAISPWRRPSSPAALFPRLSRCVQRPGIALPQCRSSSTDCCRRETENSNTGASPTLVSPEQEEDAVCAATTRMVAAFVTAAPMLFYTEVASAANGELGILEGRTFALVHPIVMGGLFIYTLWAGYLGWQWRQVRTIQGEINELKKQVKPRKEEGAPPSEIELKIEQLTEVRKGLVKGGFRDRHFNAGSILLGFGVLEAIGGCVNTWFRTGKLFPGPHLFAGAGITVLWALAAALVPAMQKGNETARNAHIVLNSLNVLLFIWQIPTGWEIVLKVFEFTAWP